MARVSLATTDEDYFTALRSFLLDILPTGVEVVQAQDNRVPEPKVDDFVVMTPMRLPRLATNIDTFVDCAFTASIAVTTMTVTDVAIGEIAVGAVVIGSGVTADTVVTAFVTGSGGTGTYTVSKSQTVASRILAAGHGEYLQKAEAVFQLDVHGPSSANNAQIISTLFRDDYAYRFFAALSGTIAPFYADDPRQMPFRNEQEQTEFRWIVEAHLQVDQTVTVQAQAFADQLDVGLIDVDVEFPPS